MTQVAALVLAGLSVQAGYVSAGRFGICLIVTVAVALYAGVGRVIASRLPGNAIGWLLCLTGLLSALGLLAEQYALFGIATAPGSVPAARIIGWLSGPLSVPVIAMVFPDGRLPSRRWRPVVWAIALITAALITTNMQAGGTVAGTFDGALEASGASYPSPVAIFPAHGWFGSLLTVILVIAFATGALVVASVFVRRRGASFERRKQLEWLGYIGLLTALWVAGLYIVTAAAPGSIWAGELMWFLMILTPVAGIPLACAIAVLKYRLYDIDRLISRTVSYAVVTGLLVGVYVGLVLLASAVLPRQDSISVAVATLAVAALFNPARRRVQHVVDRRFNRSRYDAELMITAFATRLQDATDLDTVRADLAATVDQALEPQHLSLWSGRTRS
jgi:MFS family permease